MSRYQVLLETVRDLKPKHVVEIGTWNGKRACEFMAVSDCFYTGFDLFETASKDTDEKELNVKPHHEIAEVAKSIEFAGFSKFCLIRGDTNETLPKAELEPFDFAFIDGGHSIETITNDFEWVWENIEEGGTIILDDYYHPEVKGFGCNFLQDRGEVIGTADKWAQGSVGLLKVTK